MSPLIMDDLSDDSSGDEYMVDMEHSDDDYGSINDDELEAPVAEMKEVGKGW